MNARSRRPIPLRALRLLPISDIGGPLGRLTGCKIVALPPDCSSPIRYPAIGPGWRDGMQFDQLRRREFITLLGIRSPILPLLYCSPAHECRSEVSAKEKMSCVWWPLSLVWIEQQLTQGDENDGADDRRKEYGGEGNGRFQHVPSVVASASPTQCNTLCKPLVLWATSAARPQHWRPLSVSLTHPLQRANDELGAFTHETTPPNVAGTLSSLVAIRGMTHRPLGAVPMLRCSARHPAK
jgi:hypothetical protein